MPRSSDSIDARIDALYQQSPAGFVAARNALAAALRKGGATAAAAEIKTLAKPTPGAWALNQVYWRERARFDRMIRAGDALRTLQQQMLAGRAVDSRDATAERQAALTAVVERAVAFLREDGNPVTAATRQRLATTADALSSYGSAAEGVTPGRMAEDLDAPGFAALASLGGALRLVRGVRTEPTTAPPGPSRAGMASGAPPATTPPRDQRKAVREREAAARRETAAREKAVHAAEQSLRDATRELDTVRQRASRAHAAVEALAQEQRTLEEKLARTEGRRRDADSAAAAAAEAVTAAEHVRREAEAALASVRSLQPRRR